MNSAVDNAIARIWEGYGEPLSLADIARSAILSRFHFSRIFRDATGVSPGRFLSAVRIYQAKRLLASTTLSVTEISLAVGYNSLGSFTNRFTESVGVSPTRFRRMYHNGVSLACSPAPRTLPPHGTVSGLVRLPAEYATARIYVGAFQTPIVQRHPDSWDVVQTGSQSRSTSYVLSDVTPGRWFISAVAAADSVDPEPWTRRSLLVGGHRPVNVAVGQVTSIDIALRPRRRTDLPILFAMPGLDHAGLHASEREPAAVGGGVPAGALMSGGRARRE